MRRPASKPRIALCGPAVAIGSVHRKNGIRRLLTRTNCTLYLRIRYWTLVDLESNPEQALIERILRGERHLFHDLVRPYERRVYLSALAVLRNEADAEEASQEALLKAFTHLHQFRSEAKFSTWLISITINEAKHRIRANVRLQTESLDEAPEDQSLPPAVLADWREVPLISLENRELQQLLRDAIAELPPIYREAFTLRDIDGLSVAETAQALAVSIPAVKVRLHRARMMLQRRLAPHLKSVSRRAQRLPWF